MRKILAIAPYPYLPYFSGGQKFIAGFYEHLGRSADLTVISTRKNDPSLASGYRLLPLLKNSFTRYYDPSLVNLVSSHIKELNIDTVIWEHPYYAWLALRMKKKTGVQTILHTHNIEYQRFKSMGKWWWPVLRRYEKKFFRGADRILFISDEDKKFATENWQVDPEKCIDVPFGIDIQSYPADRSVQQENLRAQYGIDPKEKILLFNGLLNYGPNLDALKAILKKINPLLLQKQLRYKILVCGKGLPEEFHGLDAWRESNIIYAGFVDDIAAHFKAADVFLNPVMSGGGVKTKMVEAIAYGTTVVSMESGAAGIRREVCGSKLVVAEDGNWEKFADEVIRASEVQSETPPGYYQYYHWDGIIRNLISSI